MRVPRLAVTSYVWRDWLSRRRLTMEPRAFKVSPREHDEVSKKVRPVLRGAGEVATDRTELPVGCQKSGLGR